MLTWDGNKEKAVQVTHLAFIFTPKIYWRKVKIKIFKGERLYNS